MYSRCRNQHLDLKQCLISSWFNNIRATPRECYADSDSDETVCGYSDEDEVYVEVLNCMAIAGCGEGRCKCPGPRPRSVWTPRPSGCGCINHQTRDGTPRTVRCYEVLNERDHLSVMAMSKSLRSYKKTTGRFRDRSRISASCNCYRNSSSYTNISNPCYADTGYPPLNKYRYESNRRMEHYPNSQWIKTGDGKWTIPQRDDYKPPSSCQQFRHESATSKETNTISQQLSCQPFCRESVLNNETCTISQQQPCQPFRQESVPCKDTLTFFQQHCESSCNRTNKSSPSQRTCLSAGKFTITGAQIPFQDGCPCFSQGSCKEKLTVNFHLGDRSNGNQTQNQVAADDCKVNICSTPRWSRYSATFKSLPSSRKTSRSSRSRKYSKRPSTETSSESKTLENSFKGGDENSFDQENSNESLQHTPSGSTSTSTHTSSSNRDSVSISENNDFATPRRDLSVSTQDVNIHAGASDEKPESGSAGSKTSSELSNSNTSNNSSNSSVETPLERFLHDQAHEHGTAISSRENLQNDKSKSHTTLSFRSPIDDRTISDYSDTDSEYTRQPTAPSKANEDYYKGLTESSQYITHTTDNNGKPLRSGSRIDSVANASRTTVSVNGEEVFRSRSNESIDSSYSRTSVSNDDTDSDVISLVTDGDGRQRKHQSSHKHSSERENLEISMREDDTPRISRGRFKRGESIRKSLLSVKLTISSSSSSSTSSSSSPSPEVAELPEVQSYVEDRVLSEHPWSWLLMYLCLLLLGLALLTALWLYFKYFNCVQLFPVRCGRTRCCFFFNGAERTEYKWRNKCLAWW